MKTASVRDPSSREFRCSKIKASRAAKKAIQRKNKQRPQSLFDRHKNKTIWKISNVQSDSCVDFASLSRGPLVVVVQPAVDGAPEHDQNVPSSAASGDSMTTAEKHVYLRAFDLDPEYGPVVGMSRSERWARADHAGLNPPPLVWALVNEHPSMNKHLWESNRHV